MEIVTLSQVHDLVTLLPKHKLPRAYQMLLQLSEQTLEGDSEVPFHQLPLSERRRILREQAQQAASFYESTAAERQEWQAGDFRDEY